jgi:hypothetical protein
VTNVHYGLAGSLIFLSAADEIQGVRKSVVLFLVGLVFMKIKEYVHMYVNEKSGSVETIPGKEEEG